MGTTSDGMNWMRFESNASMSILLFPTGPSVLDARAIMRYLIDTLLGA